MYKIHDYQVATEFQEQLRFLLTAAVTINSLHSCRHVHLSLSWSDLMARNNSQYFNDTYSEAKDEAATNADFCTKMYVNGSFLVGSYRRWSLNER